MMKTPGRKREGQTKKLNKGERKNSTERGLNKERESLNNDRWEKVRGANPTKRGRERRMNSTERKREKRINEIQERKNSLLRWK